MLLLSSADFFAFFFYFRNMFKVSNCLGPNQVLVWVQTVQVAKTKVATTKEILGFFFSQFGIGLPGFNQCKAEDKGLAEVHNSVPLVRLEPATPLCSVMLSHRAHLIPLVYTIGVGFVGV